MLLRITGSAFGCVAAWAGGGTVGDAVSVLSGAGGFQFCVGVNGAAMTRRSDNVHVCAPLCRARPTFRRKFPALQTLGKPGKASRQSARLRSSHAYQSGWSDVAQTKKGNGEKGAADALSGSTDPPYLSLVPEERKCLQAANRQP